MGARISKCAMLAAVILFVTADRPLADVLTEQTPEQAIAGANFYIAPRPNYQGAFWVFDQNTNKPIGYAPWDPVNRRWTLFTLDSQYQGFMQATLGSTNPPHFTQYLYYDKENRYKGVFVAALGGRPVTKDLPYGELGGALALHEVGNLPLEYPSYEPEVDPLRRFPGGVDVSPIERPSLR